MVGILFILQMLLMITFLMVWQIVTKNCRSIEEIKQYLNARDEIPFFEVWEDEGKNSSSGISDMVVKLRDAVPGKRPGDNGK